MSSATTAARPSPTRGKPDQTCADAVDLARAAVTEDVAGAHLEVVAEGDRVVTHYFECTMPAYRGWRWAVTVARIPRSKQVTVSETVLLPGPDALVTPDWVPWEDRVAPGDLGIGDLMPTASDDDRLAPAYLLSDDPAVEDVVWELGLGRARVLSRIGRLDAAERWYEGDSGPHTPIAQSAPAQNRCVSCGFYLPLAGAMRAMFGACANVYAPDDGKVVSGDHGCGAHSEILIEQTVEVDEAPTIYDDGVVDRVEPEQAAAVVADEPEAVAEEPTFVEEPVAVVEEPVAVEPAVEVVEEPAATVAEPVVVTDDPTTTVVEQIELVEEPLAVVEEPVAEPPAARDEPVEPDIDEQTGIPVDDVEVPEIEHVEQTGVPVDDVEVLYDAAHDHADAAAHDPADDPADAAAHDGPAADRDADADSEPGDDDPGRVGQLY